MKKSLIILTFVLLNFPLAQAQDAPVFQDSLLDRMTGKWTLRGTIAGQQTTHDVNGAWVLGHQYVQMNEVSQEREAKGHPAYEATVFIGWDARSEDYACLWLDNTGG